MDSNSEEFQQFAKDFVHCVFQFYDKANSTLKEYCQRPNELPNYYLLSKWGMILIENEFMSNGVQIRSNTKHYTDSKELNEETFKDIARILLEQNYYDVYGGLYIKCCNISDLAVYFFIKGNEKAPYLAMSLIQPLVAQAWNEGIVDSKEDVFRGMAIKLVECVFQHQGYSLPNVDHIGQFSPYIPVMWDEVKEAMNNLLENDGPAILQKLGQDYSKMDIAKFNDLYTNLSDKAKDYTDRKVIYEVFTKIALLAFHAHRIEEPVYKAVDRSIHIITRSFIYCSRRDDVQ